MTKCITTADQPGLQSALASPLIAAGNPTPTGPQEWAEAVQLMTDALNSFAGGYLQGQAMLSTPAVTYKGPN